MFFLISSNLIHFQCFFFERTAYIFLKLQILLSSTDTCTIYFINICIYIFLYSITILQISFLHGMSFHEQSFLSFINDKFITLYFQMWMFYSWIIKTFSCLIRENCFFIEYQLLMYSTWNISGFVPVKQMF